MPCLSREQAAVTLLQPARIRATELIDMPGVSERDLAGNLDDLAHINRRFGGVRLTLRGLERLIGAMCAPQPLTILDIATGGGDIPRAITDWARRGGRDVQIIASDISPQIVRLAASSGRSPVIYLAADGCRLPFGDQSVDVVLCSFALHHLEPEGVALMLGEMRRVARHGVIVNDLVRWRPAYWATWLASRLISHNRLTRHDGPLSVLRAYTRTELRNLAAAAGLHEIALDGFLGYRVALTAAVSPMDSSERADTC